MSCHSGPKQATLVLMQGQDQHGLATLVLMPLWSSYTGKRQVGMRPQQLQVVRELPFPLGATILEPDFDLQTWD